MAGRKVHGAQAEEKAVQDLLNLYRGIPHPADLSNKVFDACVVFSELPAQLKDEDQFRADIARTLELVTANLYHGDPVAPQLFWQALKIVSAREHIVLQPGANREQRRQN